MQQYVKADGLRNGDLVTIGKLLTDQRARALDVVVPASKLDARQGQLVISGGEVLITAEGVTQVDGQYDLTSVAETQLAERLDIPGKYLRRLHADAVDLWDDNVHGWLHGVPVDSLTASAGYPLRAEDSRKFLVRALRGDTDGTGLIRAILSDQYQIIDNLDVLLATLAGVQASGTEIVVDGADLTDTRMTLRIAAPGIAAYAPALLAGYRSPFDGNNVARVGGGGAGGNWTVEQGRQAAAAHGAGYAPGQEPIVFAGFVVTNSETGHGAFSITPRLVVQICRNGLTIRTDALREVHVGGKLDAGVIKWSADTQQKQLALITAQARDAVAQFLNPEYIATTIAKLEETADTPVRDAAKTIEQVAKRYQFTDAEAAAVLGHFIAGGQLTAGGVMQAVSSAAQTIEDADAAAELEAQAVPAMAYAAQVA